jgi:hypothetical protein
VQSRLKPYKAAPEAMKALGAVESYIQASDEVVELTLAIAMICTAARVKFLM